ncbi:DUF3343 domain-containing protein [Desulfosarcina sp. OttesenSCG-928-A07]|nr:DUF3343 domain-containing protein [Desulfosarcina sp. OttesenSCG-928-A07]
MNLVSRLRTAFFKPQPEKAKTVPVSRGEAFLVFSSTGEVIQAERVLKADGLPVRVMGPPPALRTGCDMVLMIPLIHGFRATAALEPHHLAPLQLIPVGEALLEPVSLFQTRDYGKWLMVRAANMKLTVEKATGRIVNVSGGGCPDVPYLAAQLVGKTIDDADLAKTHGQTLCGYALHLAAQELHHQMQKKE